MFPVIRWLVVLVLALAAPLAFAEEIVRPDPSKDVPITLGILALFLVIYLIPSVVAFRRSHPNRWAITLVNVFLGGTGLGWFGALIWALSAVHRSNIPGGSHGGESGLNIYANDPVTLRLEPNPAIPSAFTSPPLPTVSASTDGDLIDRLERLKRLHEAGAVDDDQFKRMRDRLIAEIG